MKLSKIISVFMSVLIGGALLCGTVNAEETTEETKMYTLEELFAMSDEDFLRLSSDEFNVQQVIENIETTISIMGRLSGRTLTPIYNIEGLESYLKDYEANVTEFKIKKLLGDTIKYSIYTPINMEIEDPVYLENYFYPNYIYINFLPFIDKLSPTHEEIMKMAKCVYCVNQVIPCFDDPMVPGGMLETDHLKIGDVNFDKEVNTLDLIYMAKFNLNFFMPTEAQIAMGDLNKDGNLDCLDIEMLIENLLGNFELI